MDFPLPGGSCRLGRGYLLPLFEGRRIVSQLVDEGRETVQLVDEPDVLGRRGIPGPDMVELVMEGSVFGLERPNPIARLGVEAPLRELISERGDVFLVFLAVGEEGLVVEDDLVEEGIDLVRIIAADVLRELLGKDFLGA